MLSAQPAQQGIVHHLPQEFVGPGSTHAQNNTPPGHMINHPTNFNFGPVYNMAGLGSWSPQSRGTGTDDHARKKKDELRVELEKVLCQPSNAGSWYRFDVLRTELQVLEAPLCGIVTQPDEDQ
ncbi:uncharacterized protein [Branchiostoma lanceolatum]|uniref:uncharacterized protein isoform X2 n=1 Tax=Branchiostoma lanceolatum TaxID=7740 RepID=UPI003455570E